MTKIRNGERFERSKFSYDAANQAQVHLRAERRRRRNRKVRLGDATPHPHWPNHGRQDWRASYRRPRGAASAVRRNRERQEAVISEMQKSPMMRGRSRKTMQRIDALHRRRPTQALSEMNETRADAEAAT